MFIHNFVKWSPSDWVEDTVIGSNPVTAQMKGPVHWEENIVVVDYWLMVHSGVLKKKPFQNIIRHSIFTMCRQSPIYVTDETKLRC